jgi:hypothetical protein
MEHGRRVKPFGDRTRETTVLTIGIHEATGSATARRSDTYRGMYRTNITPKLSRRFDQLQVRHDDVHIDLVPARDRQVEVSGLVALAKKNSVLSFTISTGHPTHAR